MELVLTEEASVTAAAELVSRFTSPCSLAVASPPPTLGLSMLVAEVLHGHQAGGEHFNLRSKSFTSNRPTMPNSI
jgi:hypothetical protein